MATNTSVPMNGATTRIVDNSESSSVAPPTLEVPLG